MNDLMKKLNQLLYKIAMNSFLVFTVRDSLNLMLVFSDNK